MRAFARNASSRDEEDPESPTASVSGPNTPVDYSVTTTSGLKGRPTARFSSIELIQRDFSNETPETKCLRQRQLVSIAELRSDTRLTYRFHATKVSVMEATRACPYAFPKKIQEEFDRLADEQMQKLKELARRDSLLSSD